MLQNVSLFIHLKMFKIGSMLNIIYCNKPCIACCSVWHRTTTVHLVILMWITSCKISWVFAVNCMISSTVMWACCNVLDTYSWYCHKSHWNCESQISQERGAALPSHFTGGWLHMCSFKKMHYSLHTHILSTLFSSTSVIFSFLMRGSACAIMNTLCPVFDIVSV